jgi:hypothetical protein
MRQKAASPPPGAPNTMKPVPETAQQRRRNERIQRQLDEALKNTFPASDPVSIVTSQGEEDWAEEEEEPGKTPAPAATEPSAPESSPPDSPS